MRLLGLDFETTGLEFAGVDRITEIGVVLWDVEGKRPLTTVGIFLKYPGITERCKQPAVAEMMNRVSGITPELIEEFGTDAKANFVWLESYVSRHKVEAVVAHNGTNFDRPFLLAELDRHSVVAPVLRSLPWIDTRADLPFATEPDSRKLKHLALDAGFINPFAHRAVFDVLTMMRILSNYDFAQVLAYSKLPWAELRAVVSFDENAKAKAQRYSWDPKRKWWVKQLKENQLEAEIKTCKEAGFEARRIK